MNLLDELGDGIVELYQVLRSFSDVRFERASFLDVPPNFTSLMLDGALLAGEPSAPETSARVEQIFADLERLFGVFLFLDKFSQVALLLLLDHRDALEVFLDLLALTVRFADFLVVGRNASHVIENLASLARTHL